MNQQATTADSWQMTLDQVQQQGGGFWSWLIGFLLFAIPFWVIFRRAGFSPLWALLLLIPGLGVFLCWLMLAMRDWPTRRA